MDFARRLVAVAKELLEGDELEFILQRVLEAGRDLTGARYAALGIVNDRRDGLSRFITLGLDEEERRAIGDLPHGRGVLGELIRHPELLRLTDVSTHPRSYGFPIGHPPMRSFLGAPITIRGTAFGNLYLTEKHDGEEFTETDEESVLLLAECASVAIQHAQRFDELETRREELERSVSALSATSEIHRALGGETDLAAVLELVAKRGRALVSARALAILLPDATDLQVVQVAGEVPPGLENARLGPESIASEVLRTGRAKRLNDAASAARLERAGLGGLGVSASAGLLVPLRLRGMNLGVLVALDRWDYGPDFSAADEELLSSFAVSAATGVYTAQMVGADRLRERDAAAEDERRRWARELHDETLQGLAAVRVALASAQDEDDASVRAASRKAVRDLQGEVDRLRAIIQDVRPASLDDLGLAAAVEALVARHAGPEAPALHLHSDLDYEAGHADTRLDAETESALYRIAQEALTNALKHACAKTIEIALAESDGRVGVRVRDDGAGFDPSEPTVGVGLTGVAERVELLGGQLRIESQPGAGTTIEVRVPARHRSHQAAVASAGANGESTESDAHSARM